MLYKFNVAAYNQVGESEWAQAIEVIAADLPKPPLNPPIVTLITETSISLTLEPITGPSNSGSMVTGYIVQIDDGNGGEYTEVHNSLDLILILTGLKSGRTYRIRYAARNIILDASNLFECEQLEFSEAVYVLTAVLPSVPQNLRFDDV